MTHCTHLEWSLSLQGLIEGFTPQQILNRDMMVNEFGFSQATATAVVKGEITYIKAISITNASQVRQSLEELHMRLSGQVSE